MGKNGVVLEYHSDVPFVRWYIVNHTIVDFENAALNRVEADNHAQQGGFSTARGSKKGEKFPRLDFQRESVDDRIVAIAF